MNAKEKMLKHARDLNYNDGASGMMLAYCYRYGAEYMAKKVGELEKIGLANGEWTIEIEGSPSRLGGISVYLVPSRGGKKETIYSQFYDTWRGEVNVERTLDWEKFCEYSNALYYRLEKLRGEKR